jgi:hypothetical protein
VAKPQKAQKARADFEAILEQTVTSTVEKFRAAGKNVPDSMIPQLREALRAQLLKAHKSV